MSHTTDRTGRRRREDTWEIIVFVAVILPVVTATSFAAALHIELVAEAIERSVSTGTVAIGALSGLAFYTYSVSDGAPFKLSVAIMRTACGGVFGLLAAKGAAGMGLNGNLETAIAGVAGGTGTKYLDRVAERAIGAAKGEQS